jgi:hypothetical protein
MKILLSIAGLVVALVVPAMADSRQWGLSGEDQARFDSYYSRWHQNQKKHDREQVISMEKRMQDVYAHYNIPSDTPYWRVASNQRQARGAYQGRLSSGDQARFDSYFSRWQEYRRTNDRDQIVSMERRMQDVYAHYGIPAGTPYAMVASNAQYGDDDGDGDRGQGDRWRDRLSRQDQDRFDDCYARYVEARREDNRRDGEEMERRMRNIMQAYRIPLDVPYEQIARRYRH